MINELESIFSVFGFTACFADEVTCDRIKLSSLRLVLFQFIFLSLEMRHFWVYFRFRQLNRLHHWMDLNILEEA